MILATNSFRQRLLVAAACGLVATASARAADSSSASPAAVNLGLGQAGATQTETVLVKAQRKLQKEKNAPSAVTELGQSAIQSTGISGSVASLLRQAPSVYVYQQGIGENNPVLTIRGVRGLEIADTLDGVPMQDLLAPDSFYLSNNIGGYFTLDQIDQVHVYPGVAYPNKNTFGTIGGTVAYDSKRPTSDYYLDVFGSVGSFQTYKEGFTLNSGALDSVLGTGDNALKILLQYSNEQTAGFIDHTGARYNDTYFALDKPYDDGLSKFSVTAIYNTGNGYIQNEPVPLPYLQKNGLYSNYPTNQLFGYENNDYATLIIKNDTYVSDLIPDLGETVFYLHNDNTLETWNNVDVTPPFGYPNPAAVGPAAPFINNPAGFGYGAYYGPGGPLYKAGVYPYNPLAAYPPGSKYCPQSIVNAYTAAGGVAPCGVNGQLVVGGSDTYGGQVRATIIPPDIFGIANTIQTGALVAKETSPSSRSYFGAAPDIPQTPGNLDNIFGGGFDGGVQRTIYQGYLQDKIELLNHSLLLTPGITLEGTDSSYVQSNVFDFAAGGYAAYKATKWDREWLPFFNLTYNFDQIAPMLRGLSAYATYGNSALYAPVTDFSPNAAGVPPYASIVHMYEAGATYALPNLYLRADYFYQKVDRDFGFFNFQSGPQLGQSLFDNFGQREFKGVEATAKWQITPEFSLSGNVSHLLAKYLTNYFAFVTVAEDQYGIGLKGAPISGVPDWTGTITAEYAKKNMFIDNDAVDINLTGIYTGHQNTTYDITGYANVPNFPGLEPANYTPGSCGTTPPNSCGAIRYSQLSGATVYDPNGGINPYVVFNLDMNYTLPTPQLPVLKNVNFDLNIQNLFDERFYQYYYKQISPSSCGAIPNGPLAGQPGGPYSCSPEFADAIPGQPFSVFFTVRARF